MLNVEMLIVSKVVLVSIFFAKMNLYCEKFKIKLQILFKKPRNFRKNKKFCKNIKKDVAK